MQQIPNFETPLYELQTDEINTLYDQIEAYINDYPEADDGYLLVERMYEIGEYLEIIENEKCQIM